MQYTKVSFFPTKISKICLGCVAFGGYDYGKVEKTDCINTIHAAIDCGINIFDTASIYGLGKSEEILGEALCNKKDALITTKFGLFRGEEGNIFKDLSPKKIQEELEQSLRRLRREYVDLYLIHWYDDITQIDDVISKLFSLKAQGKIRAFGCSNFKLDLMRPIINSISALQVPYNLRQSEYKSCLKTCHENHELFTMVYNVLLRGLLTGKYDLRNTQFVGTDTRKNSNFFSQETQSFYTNRLGILKKFSEKKNKTMCQISIAYVLNQPFVSCAIIGAKSPRQIKDNVQAVNTVFNEQEMNFLENLLATNDKTS